MTPLSGSLVFSETPERHPGRHEVVNATLDRGGERIPVVVKKVPLDFRQRLSKPKAVRSFATARALLARSLATPEPLAAEVVGGESWYVARRLEGASQIRAWFLHRDDPRRPRPPLPFSFEEIVDALGKLARRMHDAGVFFRDFSDGNVLVTGEAGALRLWLVDLNRARVGEAPVPPLSPLPGPRAPRPESPRGHQPPSLQLLPPGPPSSAGGPGGVLAPAADRALGRFQGLRATLAT